MKLAWKSKSFWFGILFIVVAVANVLGFTDYKPTEDVLNVAGLLTGLVIIVVGFLSKRNMPKQ